jgi:carbon storage regulator
MLVLSRRMNETIAIGDNIMVTVVEVRGDKVKLGLIVPKEMPVHRKEVWEFLHGPASWPTLDPAWLTWQDGTVLRLARAIADKGDCETLPILADALEEAGCTNAVILGHCRSAGSEARTSWVVDLILSARPGERPGS